MLFSVYRFSLISLFSSSKYSTVNSMSHLVTLANGAIVETEEVYQLIQKLADSNWGDLHWAAQRLPGNTHRITLKCHFPDWNLDSKVCWQAGALSHTQKKSFCTRMANLWRRSRSMRTGEKESSETQRLTPASWPQISSCWSNGVWQNTWGNTGHRGMNSIKKSKRSDRNISWYKRTQSRK